MRVRSRAQADLAIRVLFLGGLALGITGFAILSKAKALGITLLVVGATAAAFGPAFITVADEAGKPSDQRGEMHD